MSAIALLRRFWPAIAIALLLAAMALQHMEILRKDAKIQHYADVMQTNEARVTGATATFRANAEREARRIEAAQNKATQEASGEIEAQRARASAVLAAYIRVRNGKAASGGTGGSSAGGGSSHAPGGAAGAGGMSELDEGDLLICTTNTIKAQGWLAWWKKVSAIPR